MRIGFVTPEYATRYRDGGGLGTYLVRIARALADEGHAVEVLVADTVDAVEHDAGVTVRLVDTATWMAWAKRAASVTKWMPRGDYAVQSLAPCLAKAGALASALRRRERQGAFDLVQSADYQGVGAFVRPRARAGRPHIVRCSAAADLWGLNRWQAKLERAAIRRADAAYAPSRFVASHLSRTLERTVGVVRPPLMPEPVATPAILPALPARFLIHFGQIMERKGSAQLARALPLVWARDASVHVVWAGHIHGAPIDEWRAHWGAARDHVHVLGALEKPILHAVLSRSVASILPSLVDNLPNTVVESLQHDKPVIGTRGTSIDELVVHGVNGLLVDPGDHAALAEAILDVWRGRLDGVHDLARAAPIWEEMQPKRAVQALLQFALTP